MYIEYRKVNLIGSWNVSAQSIVAKAAYNNAFKFALAA
jgi:hypothetical protein